MNFFFKTLIVFFSLYTLSSPLFAQKDSTSAIKYSWGISIGFIKPNIRFKTTDWVKNGLADTLKSVVNNTSINDGFSIGYQGHLHVNHSWVLRISPELVLHRMNFTFFQQNGLLKNSGRDIGSIEIPFHLIYNFLQTKFRFSIFLGGRYCLDIPSKSRGFQTTKLNLLNDSNGFDMGIGVNLKLKGMMLRPEIMYFYNTNNILKFENIYPQFKTFSELKRDYLTLKLNFCGLK